MDYRVFFIYGTSLIAVGVSLMASIGSAFVAFLGCGVVFMMIGLTNRDKWENPRKKLEQGTKNLRALKKQT